MRKAVFLDRDGVLNIDHGFVHRIEDWEWVPGAQEAIHRLKEHGYQVIVVTNQSGIGRGFFTGDQVNELHQWVNEQLDGQIDAYYLCPHVDEDHCECRKPKPGMLLQAIKDRNIDPSNSFLLGDKDRDIQAAEAANVKAYLFEHGNLDEFIIKVLDARQG